MPLRVTVVSVPVKDGVAECDPVPVAEAETVDTDALRVGVRVAVNEGERVGNTLRDPVPLKLRV